MIILTIYTTEHEEKKLLKHIYNFIRLNKFNTADDPKFLMKNAKGFSNNQIKLLTILL